MMASRCFPLPTLLRRRFHAGGHSEADLLLAGTSLVVSDDVAPVLPELLVVPDVPPGTRFKMSSGSVVPFPDPDVDPDEFGKPAHAARVSAHVKAKI